MPCHVDEPSIRWDEHLEMMLEEACRMLTREQINSIRGGNSGYVGAGQWYAKHLLHDYSKNYNDIELRTFYEKEAERLGLSLGKNDNGLFCIRPFKQ